MSDRPRKPDLLDRNGIDAWASVPREVVLRAMGPDQCLDSRLRHAMILWSWCGPDQPTEAVYKRDSRGYLMRDGVGKPIPAQFKDLVELLGLRPEWKGHISRAAAAMRKQKLLRVEAGKLFLIFKPSAFDPKDSVTSTGNWNIAGVVVSTDNLPADPVTRTEVLRFIESCSTQWKTDLQAVKTRNRLLLVQGLSGFGISIEKRKKRLREEQRTDGPSSQAAGTPATAATVRPSDPPPSIRKTLRTWLTATFKVPLPLEDDIFEQIAAQVADDQALRQFQEAAQGAQPRKWVMFIGMAKKCAAQRPQYTMAAGSSTPQTLRNDGAERLRRKVRDRILAGEAADVIDFGDLTDIVMTLASMPFFPADDNARLGIIEDIGDIVHSLDEARWLVKRARKVFPQWPGIYEIRACFCAGRKPRDGFDVSSVFFPDGIPPELPASRRIAAPPMKALQPGEPVTSDPEFGGLLREVGDRTAIRQRPAAPSRPHIAPVTAAEIEALKKLQAARASHDSTRAFLLTSEPPDDVQLDPDL